MSDKVNATYESLFGDLKDLPVDYRIDPSNMSLTIDDRVSMKRQIDLQKLIDDEAREELKKDIANQLNESEQRIASQLGEILFKQFNNLFDRLDKIDKKNDEQDKILNEQGIILAAHTKILSEQKEILQDHKGRLNKIEGILKEADLL